MYTYFMINGEKHMKTVKIAICDDEKGVRDILRQKIDKHCKNSEFICQIYDLETGDGLLALPDEKIESFRS